MRVATVKTRKLSNRDISVTVYFVNESPFDEILYADVVSQCSKKHVINPKHVICSSSVLHTKAQLFIFLSGDRSFNFINLSIYYLFI